MSISCGLSICMIAVGIATPNRARAVHRESLRSVLRPPLRSTWPDAGVLHHGLNPV